MNEAEAVKYLNKYKIIVKNNGTETSKAIGILLQSLENSISKDVIREKINKLYKQDEEWTDELEDPTSEFDVIDKNLKRIKIEIDILENLLKEEKEDEF